jgi:SAM-dependent MidA family methyltransferase
VTPLREKLISRIRAYGPMTVAEYMEACLSDPFYGYYMRREPFRPLRRFRHRAGGELRCSAS